MKQYKNTNVERSAEEGLPDPFYRPLVFGSARQMERRLSRRSSRRNGRTNQFFTPMSMRMTSASLRTDSTAANERHKR